MAELAAARTVLRLAWQLFAPKVASKLEKGDPAVEAIRNYLLTEFQKLHEHLNALRRKDLAAAVHYLENGYTVMKSDKNTSIEEFKKARDAAHLAFGVVKEMTDKLLALKIAVLSTLHEFQDNLETCGNMCLKYLERLNQMPEVVKATESIFDKTGERRLLSMAGKGARKELLEGTALINKSAWVYFESNGIVNSMNWPRIKLSTKSVHPVYDLALFRVPRLIGTLEDSFDGINTAVFQNGVFYVAGSSKAVPNTITVLQRDQRETKHLVGHSGMVLCLLINDNWLFSGSFDKTIIVWNIKTLECKQILNGHSGSVRCMSKSERFLYSGSADSTLLVWDIISLKQVEKVDARNPIVSIESSRKKFVFTLTVPASVLIWLVAEENHSFLRKVDVPLSTSSICMADNFLLALAKDRVDVWNLGSFTSEVKMAVNALKACLCQSKRYVIFDCGGGCLQQFEVRNGKMVIQETCSIGDSNHSPEVIWAEEGNIYGIIKSNLANDFSIVAW